MKKFKYILLALLVPVILYGLYSVRNNNNLVNTVRAFGNLTATYLGVPLGQPIFNITNLMPGSVPITRTVIVKNDSNKETEIYVKSIRKGPANAVSPRLETTLDLQIKNGGAILYSNKLSKFFEDTAGEKGLKLKDIPKKETLNFDFIVSFPASAGNEYQGKSVLFDITFSENEGEVKGAKDPHDNRFDEKHPDKGNDVKGHNNPNDRKEDKKQSSNLNNKIDNEIKKITQTIKSVLSKTSKK